MANFSAEIVKALALLLIVNVMTSSADTLGEIIQGIEENFPKLAIANNDFGLKLYQRLTEGSSNNAFFSPLSLSTAFGMLFYGARGLTANEMRDVLGYERANLSSELVHSSFSWFLIKDATERILNPGAGSEHTLNVANALLLAKELDVRPRYKRNVQRLYGAIVEDVDFVRDTQNVTERINTYVRDVTNNKIRSMFDELDPSTIMVLLNAIYFKGAWKNPFLDGATEPLMFYNGGTEADAKEIPMMYNKGKFPYAEVDDMQILELPYKGNSISMIFFLPRQRDGLASLEKNLTLEKFTLIQRQLSPRRVILSIPKFKIEYSRELSLDMQALGSRSMFSAIDADFSGMVSDKNASISVSQILHKAFIEVNEAGSEAAAAVTMAFMARSNRPTYLGAPEFNADHPFMFAIVDKTASDLMLFVGRVNSL